jgi:MFS family permease
MRRVYYGWWVVTGALVLLFCSVGSQFYAFPVFFEAMLRDMEWSRAKASAAVSMSEFVLGVMGFGVGVIIHRTGVKKVMIFGSIVAGIGFVLLSSVTCLWQFYVYYGLILSIGSACVQVIPNITAVESWFVQRRSTAIGVAIAGIGAGGAVMAPFAGWLISAYSWRTAFLVLAVIVTMIGVPISAIVMRTSEDGESSAARRQGKDVNSDEISAVGITLGEALKGRAFWLISLAVMLWSWGYSAALVHQVVFAVDMGIERLIAAGAIGLLTAFSILGRLGFGRLGDLIDKRFVLMMGTCFQIGALIVLMSARSATMLYIYSFLIGVSVGGIAPILPGLVADYFGKRHFGAIYGASHLVLSLGVMIGPVYAGWIFDTTASYSIAFLTSIGLSIMAIVSIYLLGKVSLPD